MVAASLSAGSCSPCVVIGPKPPVKLERLPCVQMAALALECAGRFWLGQYHRRVLTQEDWNRRGAWENTDQPSTVLPGQEEDDIVIRLLVKSQRGPDPSPGGELARNTSGRASDLLRSCENSPAEGAVAAEPFLRVVCRVLFSGGSSREHSSSANHK